MIFETDTDLLKEKKAIELFVGVFGGSYKKLDPNDVDYKIFDKDDSLVAYAEVRIRPRSMRMAYPLSIDARKLVKLVDKRLAPVIIWACDDGIIYGKPNNLSGEIKWGGNPPHANDLVAHYDKQKEFKYVRYV